MEPTRMLTAVELLKELGFESGPDQAIHTVFANPNGPDAIAAYKVVTLGMLQGFDTPLPLHSFISHVNPYIDYKSVDAIDEEYRKRNLDHWNEVVGKTGAPIKLGVITFHTPQNKQLIEDFYAVIDDCTQAAQIVDVFLMDIASVLERHGYEMKIYKKENNE